MDDGSSITAFSSTLMKEIERPSNLTTNATTNVTSNLTTNATSNETVTEDFVEEDITEDFENDTPIFDDFEDREPSEID